MDSGYANRMWITFKQTVQLGGRVRKGEHGTQITFTNVTKKLEEDGEGNEVEKTIPFLKAYSVFNVEQIEGLPEQYYAKSSTTLFSDEFFTNTGATIIHGGNRAAYSMKRDIIYLPEPAAFIDHESYYATKAHELVHWTKHESADRNSSRVCACAVARDQGARRGPVAAWRRLYV